MNEEAVHKKLYEAHRFITGGANMLHEAIMAITAEGRHKETREKFNDVLVKLCAARDLADAAWTDAARARSDLIRLTGCDGKCS